MKHRISRSALMRRLEDLEKNIDQREQVDLIFIIADQNGGISMNYRTASGSTVTPDPEGYTNMFEADSAAVSVPGFTSRARIYIDDLEVASNDLEVPGYPYLYFGSPEDRKQLADEADPAEWLQIYLRCLDRALSAALEDPNIDCEWLSDPAVRFLIENRNGCSLDQLVKGCLPKKKKGVSAWKK